MSDQMFSQMNRAALARLAGRGQDLCGGLREDRPGQRQKAAGSGVKNKGVLQSDCRLLERIPRK